jgi:23S rRNA (adenine2030-N6)-methyltransferase
MFAYRHAFHAGNHADVLKHMTLLALLRHLNQKEKGWRYVDTHAGAGGYSLESDYANKRAEYKDGIARLWGEGGKKTTPALVTDYLAEVKSFNEGKALTQYPGSPALAAALMRPQDSLRLYERHPTDHKILASYLGETPGVEVAMTDGFAGLQKTLPPPTRRGLVHIDPSYEMKADYSLVLVALREALQLFADGLVMIWLPQVQLLEAAQLPQRLKASTQGVAKKGWLLARLSVRTHGSQEPGREPGRVPGFGLLGSSVFVVNPPHTLAPALRSALPWLAERLAQDSAEAAPARGRGAPAPLAWQVDAHTP